MVRLFAPCLVALAAVSSALAARLSDGTYRIVYTPPPTLGLLESPPHYLTLTAPNVNATFSPAKITGEREKTQQWTVTTSATDSTWRYIESVGQTDISLGYPAITPGTRVRGVNDQSEDYIYFNIIDAETEGDNYFVRPYISKDVALNGDTQPGTKNRYAYLRQNSRGLPDVTPLRFELVNTPA